MPLARYLLYKSRLASFPAIHVAVLFIETLIVYSTEALRLISIVQGQGLHAIGLVLGFHASCVH